MLLLLLLLPLLLLLTLHLLLLRCLAFLGAGVHSRKLRLFGACKERELAALQACCFQALAQGDYDAIQ